jgi:glycosyltransferase involved in cell wall biosynthesis
LNEDPNMSNKSGIVPNSQQCTLQNEYLCLQGTTSQNIIVILPAFEEEVSIGSMVLLSKLYADKVIVVDDGSTDRTADIARKAGAEVIIHEKNTGKGTALKTGFAAAVEMGADVIITMDSDAQHNPADIPKLAAPIIKGEADVVNGSRYINGSDKNTPAYRRVGQTVLDKVTNMKSGLQITDSQSGFRAFAASIVGVFRFNSTGMAIESEMLADVGEACLRIKEVEITVRYDVDGSTVNPIQHGLQVLVSILKDVEFKRPLYYFAIPGTFFGIIGVVMGANFLETFSRGGSLDFGPTILMVLLIIVGGFMIITGVLLHSLSTLLSDVKEV